MLFNTNRSGRLKSQQVGACSLVIGLAIALLPLSARSEPNTKKSITMFQDLAIAPKLIADPKILSGISGGGNGPMRSRLPVGLDGVGSSNRSTFVRGPYTENELRAGRQGVGIGDIGEQLETAAQDYARKNLGGRYFVDAKRPNGSGFDLPFVAESGGGPRLFIGEAKNRLGAVSTDEFTAFGLGRNPKQFDKNLNLLRIRISESDMPLDLRLAARQQIEDRSFGLYIFGNQATHVPLSTMDLIRQVTRVTPEPLVRIPVPPIKNGNGKP
jgi:hypothetical protein